MLPPPTSPSSHRVEPPLDPPVYAVRRIAPAVNPETRGAILIEMVKASPYHAVPVIDRCERFLGMVTEAGIARALLSARSTEERAAVRERMAAELMEAPDWWALPRMAVSEVAVLMDQSSRDVLPVLDRDFSYRGMVGRGDLVVELARPFQPPTLGGMATPLGVYLTNGRVSGGAGDLGLALTGLALFVVQFPLLALVVHLGLRNASLLPATWYASLHAALPPLLLGVLGDIRDTAVIVLMSLPVLVALRLSPLAGYHAAEHQVVHAVERGEPLLPDAVRRMPRVHPRCGTNIVAGAHIVTTIGMLTAKLPMGVGWILGGMAALVWWRSFGSWLQLHLTTRPANDAQIESALRAAREVLARDGAMAPDSAPVRPQRRLWRMGMLQIILGFGTGFAILALLAWLSPTLGAILNPVIHYLLTN